MSACGVFTYTRGLVEADCRGSGWSLVHSANGVGSWHCSAHMICSHERSG